MTKNLVLKLDKEGKYGMDQSPNAVGVGTGTATRSGGGKNTAQPGTNYLAAVKAGVNARKELEKKREKQIASFFTDN